MKRISRRFAADVQGARLIQAVALALGVVIVLSTSVSAGTGLLLGAAAALTFGNDWTAFTRRVTHWLLLGSIVGLGAGANLGVVAQVGARGLVLTAGSIAGCLLLAAWLMRLFRVPRQVGLLIGIGTAICGGSAIAAVAPIMRARDEEISVSLATVFLLNGVALFVFPAVGVAVGLTPHQFSHWAALAIHDTSSVVGAALAFGHDTIEVATTLKLTRALWIVPLALALSVRRRARGDASETRVPKPWFLVGFLIAAALNTWVPAFHAPGLVLVGLAKRAMVVALLFVGAGLSRPALRAVGMRPLAYGIVLWLIVGSTTLALISAGLL
jgi:uncharacterized integral membrane protein (TIGR00698 family)